MLYYNRILNIDDKKLHENTAEARECIIGEHSATGCYDTILSIPIFTTFKTLGFKLYNETTATYVFHHTPKI
jgi:hypothetical protein